MDPPCLVRQTPAGFRRSSRLRLRGARRDSRCSTAPALRQMSCPKSSRVVERHVRMHLSDREGPPLLWVPPPFLLRPPPSPLLGLCLLVGGRGGRLLLLLELQLQGVVLRAPHP